MKISKTAVLLANEHHSGQKKCCKQFSYIFCYVIVHGTMGAGCQRKWHQGGFNRNGGLIIT